MTPKILFVDDEPNLLEACQRNLRRQFTIETAQGGEQGLARLKKDGPYAVIVADMQMPGMNGIEFLRQAEVVAPDSVRIMMTGNADQKTAVDAVNHGRVFLFLSKPCDLDDLVQAVQDGLHQYQLVMAERELLEKTLNGAVKILIDVLSAVDSNSFGRGRLLRDSVRTFLQSYPVSKPWEIELAAMLSTIGRVTLPPALLAKERNGQTLTPAEREMMLRVPEVGADLLEQIPRLENVALLVRYQNKGYDGTGYPAKAPVGAELPIGARILKVLGDLLSVEMPPCSQATAMVRMQRTASCYDPDILSRVLDSISASSQRIMSPGLPPGVVSVEELRAGNTLLTDIKTLDGMLVVTAGTVLSPMLVQRLRNFRALGSIGSAVMMRP